MCGSFIGQVEDGFLWRRPEGFSLVDHSVAAKKFIIRCGGLEPWNFMTFRKKWEFHHPN